MISLDLQFAPFAVALCTVAFVYLLWRHPCGAAFYSYTVIGLGWVPIYGDYRFATFITGVQALGVLVLWLRAFHRGKSLEVLKVFTGAGSLLAWVLLLVWIKIGVDISFSGIGVYQLEALKTAIYLVFEPVALFAYALATTERRRIVPDILIGLLLMSVAYIAPTVPAMLIEERLQLAVLGLQRLTIYNLDTINSARFFFFGAVAILGFLTTGSRRPPVQMALWTGFAILTVLLFLNTTRQFVFALGLAVALVLPQVMRQRAGQIVLTVLVMAGIGVVVASLVRREELKERLTAEQIQFELQMQRGEIWKAAFLAGIDRPLLGAGFRRFGNLTYVYDPTTGDANETMSNAHGVFQDVWAEEGAIMGTLLIAAFLFSIGRAVRVGWAAEGSIDFRFLTIIIIAMIVPTMLSGSIYESLALHAFAVVLSLTLVKRGTVIRSMRTVTPPRLETVS